MTSHVQNHACSESLSNIHVVDLRLWKYLFYVKNFTLMVYVKSNPEGFQMVICCFFVGFFYSMFMCFFLLMKVCLLLFYCSLFLSYLMLIKVFDRTPDKYFNEYWISGWYNLCYWFFEITLFLRQSKTIYREKIQMKSFTY